MNRAKGFEGLWEVSGLNPTKVVETINNMSINQPNLYFPKVISCLNG